MQIQQTGNKTSSTPAIVAEAILEQLRMWGVRRIYGVVGDSIFGFMDAFAKQTEISFIAVKHESVAAMMASAEAKLTGRLGVCTAHMGPGLANLINGLGDAFLDRVPVLVITGQAPLNKIGTPYKQFINQQQLMQAISSFSELVVHPDAVLDSLSQAMQKSILYQTVAHLSIPSDVFSLSTTTLPKEQPRISFPCCPDPEETEQALKLMRCSKRPIVLVGKNVRTEPKTIQSLAELWGAGIVMSYGAMGTIPDSSPLMLNGLGEGGNPFLAGLFRQADMVLSIESSWWPEGCVPMDTRIVQIAKQPTDLGTPVPVDLGLVGDAANIIPILSKGLEAYESNPVWFDQIKHCKQAWSSRNERERLEQTESGLHPANIIRIMEQHITQDAIIALDEGDSTLWFLRNFRANSQQVLLSERWRTMGFGLPAAMAAKLVYPDKQVVCITGDGGFAMVMADLLTAAKYGLRMIVIVFNNGALQMERDKMFMKGMQPEGTLLTNPNFALVAEACGWISYRIDTIEQLEIACKDSLNCNKPALLDVHTAGIPHPDFN